MRAPSNLPITKCETGPEGNRITNIPSEGRQGNVHVDLAGEREGHLLEKNTSGTSGFLVYAHWMHPDMSENDMKLAQTVFEECIHCVFLPLQPPDTLLPCKSLGN